MRCMNRSAGQRSPGTRGETTSRKVSPTGRTALCSPNVSTPGSWNGSPRPSSPDHAATTSSRSAAATTAWRSRVTRTGPLNRNSVPIASGARLTAVATGPTARLLASCPDQPGIIAAATALVAGHGGNVIDLQQHTDHTDQAFFLRLEFELDGFDLAREDIVAAFAPLAERFAMHATVGFSDQRPRLGLLASQQAHCVHDLLHRWREGELAVDIPVLVSNHPDHEGAAAWFGVEHHHLPIVDGDKAAQEAQVRAVLRAHDVDLVVLARYMQILSPEFCDEWAGRIIN